MPEQPFEPTDTREAERRLVAVSDIEEQCALLRGNIANWLYALKQNPYLDHGECANYEQ